MGDRDGQAGELWVSPVAGQGQLMGSALGLPAVLPGSTAHSGRSQCQQGMKGTVKGHLKGTKRIQTRGCEHPTHNL